MMFNIKNDKFYWGIYLAVGYLVNYLYASKVNLQYLTIHLMVALVLHWLFSHMLPYSLSNQLFSGERSF